MPKRIWFQSQLMERSAGLRRHVGAALVRIELEAPQVEVVTRVLPDPFRDTFLPTGRACQTIEPVYPFRQLYRRSG